MARGTNSGQVKRVWSGEDQVECVSICERFKAAGIPFSVDQHRRQFLKGVDEHYQITVPREFLGEAQRILARGRLDFTDEPQDLSVMELAEDGRADLKDLLHSASEDGGARTVQIYREDGPDKIWMVELSLRENAIDFRAEVSQDGSRKLFVSPQDAALALEIVREITSGTPPT